MRKEKGDPVKLDPLPPVATAEAREERAIGLAMDLVEQRLRDGTATSQETTHFLKLASQRERLEVKLKEQEIELAKAKINNLKAAEETKALYAEAIAAFRSYQGDYDEYDDEDI